MVSGYIRSQENRPVPVCRVTSSLGDLGLSHGLWVIDHDHSRPRQLFDERPL